MKDLDIGASIFRLSNSNPDAMSIGPEAYIFVPKPDDITDLPLYTNQIKQQIEAVIPQVKIQSAEKSQVKQY